MSLMAGANTPQAPAADPHAGHDMSSMPGMAAPNPTPAGAAADPHAGHDMSAMAGANASAGGEAAAEPPIPQTPPPPAPLDHAADRYFDPAAMAAARRQLSREHGGAVYSKVMASIAEYQARSGGDGYRWEGEGWYGGDINRLVAKTEGEGSFRGVERAELQALYSRAVGRYFDVQAGVRQDFKPGGRTYLTVGTEGLFPYWFEVEGALFLSTTGELLARAEGTYDFRLTQRLILQPRAELNLAAQNTRQTRTGEGLADAEFGLRLRYEIRREFAPYIGVSYERKFGRTADFARAAGERVRSASFVAGVRAWF
jgi:copper resistance protein B